MATDQEALLLQVSADVSRLEKQFAKAVSTVDVSSGQMERRTARMAQAVNDNLGRANVGKALGEVWSRQTSQIVEEGTSKIGAMGAGLEHLGTAGAVAAVAIAALAAGLELAEKTLDWAEELEHTAAKIGITVTALQELDYAAQQGGINVATARQELEGLDGALGKMIIGSAKGNVKKAFADLGFTPDQLKGYHDAAEILPEIADRISKLHNAAEQVAIAKALGLSEWLPLLKEGSAGVEELTTKFREQHIEMDAHTIKDLAEMNHQLKDSKSRIGEAAHELGAAFAPALIWVNRLLADSITKLAQFLSYMAKGPALSGQWATATANAFKAQQRAAALRSGDPLAAVNAGAAGFGLDPAVNELAAKRADADAAAYLKQAAAARAQLDADAVAARSGAPPDGGGGGGGGGGGRGGGTPGERATKALIFLTQKIMGSEEAWDDFALHLRALGKSMQAIDEHNFPGGIINQPKTVNVDLQTAPFHGGGIFNGHVLNESELTDLHDQFAASIRGGLEAAIHGGWKGLASYMAETLASHLMDRLSNSLADILLGSSGGGGGGGGLLSSVFHLFGFADGTSSAPGGWSLVGEKGPELMNVPRGAQIIPNNLSGAMLGGRGAGGGTVNLTINVDAQNALLVDQVTHMVAAGVAAAIPATVRLASQQARADLSRGAYNALR